MSVAYLAFVIWTLIGFLFWGGAHAKMEWRDIWLGIFWGKDAIYVCFIPCVVFIFPHEIVR